MRTKLSQSWKRLAISGAVVAMTSTSAFAATQGTTGFTSTGDLNITLTVQNEVKISNLTDIALGTFTGTDLTGTSAACVYRNGPTSQAYNITATGNGPANAFQLAEAAPGLNTVPYTVQYNDGSGNAGLTSGLAALQGNATNADDDCTTDPNNGTITVTVAAANAASLPAATYNGVLTLLVSPQ